VAEGCLRYAVSVALQNGVSACLKSERTGVQSSISADGVEHGNVFWQLQLARAGLDSGEWFVEPGFAEPLIAVFRSLPFQKCELGLLRRNIPVTP
jgi:hypothetical protein